MVGFHYIILEYFLTNEKSKRGMMDMKENKMTSFEVCIAVLIYMVSTSIYNNYPQFTGKHNVWISSIIGVFIGVFYIFIYMSLSSNYPNKNIIQINEIIYGKYLGKVISMTYIFVFSLQLLDTLLWSSFLLEESIIPDGSRVFAIILIIVVCLISIKNGIMPVIRYSIILVVMACLTLIVTYLLLLKEIEFSNLLPIDVPMKDIIKGTIALADFNYGESIYLFFIIFPSVCNIKKVLYDKKRYVYYTVILGGLYSILVFVRNGAVIGNLSILYRFYYLNVVRNIEIGETRLELLFILENISFLFFLLCVIFYAIIYGTAQVINTKNYQRLSIYLGTFYIGITVWMVVNISNVVYGQYYEKVYNYLIPVLKLGLPIITMLILYLRKKWIKNLPGMSDNE